MQTGIHAGGGLIGDFDGILQDPSGDVVLIRVWCWLPGDEHPVVWVTVNRCRLEKSIKRGQPSRHQVHILNNEESKRVRHNVLNVDTFFFNV